MINKEIKRVTAKGTTMYRQISKLIIFSDIDNSGILTNLGKIFEDFHSGNDTPDSLRTRIYAQIRRLLDIATKYGFDNNLWHNYLTYLIINHENPINNIVCVLCIGGLFAIRRFLIPKSDLKVELSESTDSETELCRCEDEKTLKTE